MRKHFTATGYIVSKIDKKYKVLLHKHKKLNIWIGIGGHVEKEENPLQTLLREIKEETNLKIKLLKDEGRLVKTSTVTQLPTPQVIIEEKIPPYKDEPAHFHVDHIYFAFCKNPKNIKMSEDYRWFSNAELKKNDLEIEVKTYARKAIDKVRLTMVSLA